MKEFIASRYDTFVSDLKTIVNQDSSSGNSKGIALVAHFFEQRFTKLGMACEITFEGEGKVPCLKVESIPGQTPYDLMCLGHMDTVFPEGETAIRPFSEDGKRGYGPGVCDMKGGLLVVLHAMEALHHKGLLDKLSVCVAFNGDEETGSAASRPWIEAVAGQSRRVLVFEPCRPGYNVVRQRKGGGWFHVTTKGCSAHAGADPEKGINAVVELAHQVARINTLNDSEKGTSAQVTVVSGGEKVNIIPDKARASVDVRISKIEERETVEQFFKELTQKPYLPGAVIEVSGGIDRPPMETGPGADTLFEQILDCAADFGISPGGISTGGCSDGNFTAAGGTPTVDGMGIVGANSHREDEYVEFASIVPMVGLLAHLCESFISK